MALKYSWIMAFSLMAIGAAAPAQARTAVQPELDRGADQLEAQPHMKAALATLESAKSQLEKASHDKGGHRAKALELTKLAIGEVNQAIQFDNQHASFDDDALPLEAQPHMKTALATLETAKRQLEKASHDKGGHRVKALGYVKQAIGEVQQGIKYDNQH